MLDIKLLACPATSVGSREHHDASLGKTALMAAAQLGHAAAVRAALAACWCDLEVRDTDEMHLHALGGYIWDR